jgi:hypothetical protein
VSVFNKTAILFAAVSSFLPAENARNNLPFTHSFITANRYKPASNGRNPAVNKMPFRQKDFM